MDDECDKATAVHQGGLTSLPAGVLSRLDMAKASRGHGSFVCLWWALHLGIGQFFLELQTGGYWGQADRESETVGQLI